MSPNLPWFISGHYKLEMLFLWLIFQVPYFKTEDSELLITPVNMIIIILNYQLTFTKKDNLSNWDST